MSGYQRDRTCEDYSYYDKALGSCTPCDHLCDHHEYQGTTQQCFDKCFKYYQKLERFSRVSTTFVTTTNRITDETTSPERGGEQNDNLTAPLIVVASILILGCFIAGFAIFWTCKKKRGGRKRKPEEKKMPVPCSEDEGINHLAESQKRLISGIGPVCHPVDNYQYGDCRVPIAEPRQTLLDRTFTSHNVLYAVLDQPLTSSTPMQSYSDTNCASGVTKMRSLTTPKIVYTNDSESEDTDSRREGTIAEYLEDSDLYR